MAVTYAAAAFVTLQAARLIFPATTLEGLYDELVVLAFVGFPIAVVIAWAFELTPEGVKRTREVEPGGETAVLQAALGDDSEALTSLTRAAEAARRSQSASLALRLRYFYPEVLAPLETEPRYRELLREINVAWGLNPDGSLPDSVNVSFEGGQAVG